MERKLFLFFIDVVVTLIAGIFALFVRFGFDFLEMGKYNESVYIYVAIASAVYIINGNYSIIWRYASPKDFLLVFRGSFIAYLSALAFFYIYRDIVLPRSVGMITFLGSYVLLITARLFYQFFVHISKRSEKKIVVIGAGDAGVMITNELHRTGTGRVVAFVDDSRSKIGRRILGIKVDGPINKVMDVVHLYDADEVLIAIPSATGDQIRKILKYLNLDKVKVKILPRVEELLKDRVELKDIRDLSLEDIIGRESVKVDLETISRYIRDKVVLVTGAGGSIGSELCRQIAKQMPKRLILLGRGENSIYEINEELAESFPDLHIDRVIGDVENEEWMKTVFKRYSPEIVFHAAAHKHVPLMEENPYEAIRVNVFGTINLVKNACEFNVERFIFISTDKAVNPTSFMGLSKRIAELYVLSNTKECVTKFAVVRFGNVIGSRGSVLWKFKKQIEQNKPITITDPRMKRYFMSIPEAVSLVLEAGAYTYERSLYVLNMGEQISVEQVARTLAKLMGKSEVEIIYTGKRPGEKLYEELFYEYEIPVETYHSKIWRVKESPIFSRDEIEFMAKKILEHLQKWEINEALKIAKKIIPELNIER
ncbi:polysaccharide biosynthesis protein [Thermosipho ferrireducens]|uniref:Polysaccharide biosynthesis protein n=1 Tax=Thermosipho ferrireducens TaxID=2571116 RepID=A0ABX7S4D3_9BACT|nr:nucleoside-diphosphate sugar epimerase/dehydratase [Thermosipho ferrireducens]QTA37257.1 polysaccharide biosynthesis protein [Thermosipho ferrireducens]